MVVAVGCRRVAGTDGLGEVRARRGIGGAIRPRVTSGSDYAHVAPELRRANADRMDGLLGG